MDGAVTGPVAAPEADDPACAPAAPALATPATPATPTAPVIAELSPAACAQRLGELFPAVFAVGTPLPLKLRIQADIQQRAPGIFTKKSLSIFLHRYTTTTAYLRALVGAPERIDLDGIPAGPVSDEHRAAANTELQRRRAIVEARRVAERAAQRQAGEAERRHRQAQDQALSERAALLRAFETTTLTRKNFCALRNLAEDELDAVLAQARVEREQRPLRPSRAPHAAGRPDGHRGGDARGPDRPRRGGGGRGRPNADRE